MCVQPECCPNGDNLCECTAKGPQGCGGDYKGNKCFPRRQSDGTWRCGATKAKGHNKLVGQGLKLCCAPCDSKRRPQHYAELARWEADTKAYKNQYSERPSSSWMSHPTWLTRGKSDDKYDDDKSWWKTRKSDDKSGDKYDDKSGGKYDDKSWWSADKSDPCADGKYGGKYNKGQGRKRTHPGRTCTARLRSRARKSPRSGKYRKFRIRELRQFALLLRGRSRLLLRQMKQAPKPSAWPMLQ